MRTSAYSTQLVWYCHWTVYTAYKVLARQKYRPAHRTIYYKAAFLCSFFTCLKGFSLGILFLTVSLPLYEPVKEYEYKNYKSKKNNVFHNVKVYG